MPRATYGQFIGLEALNLFLCVKNETERAGYDLIMFLVFNSIQRAGVFVKLKPPLKISKSATVHLLAIMINTTCNAINKCMMLKVEII